MVYSIAWRPGTRIFSKKWILIQFMEEALLSELAWRLGKMVLVIPSGLGACESMNPAIQSLLPQVMCTT